MVLYIHGIGQHPPKQELKQQWDLALFGKPMTNTSFAYWADILHGRASRPRATSVRREAEQHSPEVSVTEVLNEAKVPESDKRAAGVLIKGLAAAIAHNTGGSADTGRGSRKKVMPLPGGLRRRVAAFFLKRFLKDVAAYFYQPGKRDQIQDRLRAALSKVRDEFVLVSHSLGTVVAFEVLSEAELSRKCTLFVTLGSPLGIREVQDVLEDFGGKLVVPRSVSAWHNFADRLDPVAIDAVLANDFQPRKGREIIDHRIVNRRTTGLFRIHPHSAVGYLSHPDVRRIVHSDTGFDSWGRFVVARDVAEDFIDPEVRRPVLIEALEPGYAAVDEPLKKCRNREENQPQELASLPGRITWLKKRVTDIAVDRTLGEKTSDKKRKRFRTKIGAVALRKYVAANLTADEIVSISGAHEELNVYAIWRDSRKRKLIDRSHGPIKADAGRASYGATGDGITWAVLDTGVHWDHPHFGMDTISEVWDCTKPTDEPIPMFRDGQACQTHRIRHGDPDGHGTHVCGIIAGSYESNAQRYSGIAPRAKLLVYKVLDDDGFGNDAWIIKAIDHIFYKNQSVVSGLCVHGVNLSLGGPFDATVYGCGFSPICKELRDLWRQGTLVCVAAGNEGRIAVDTEDGAYDLNAQVSIGDPANLQDCIAVGSVNADKPHLYGVSWFSSRGPTADGRSKPDLVAPGERIQSCNAAFSKRNSRSDVAAESLYRTESGTSQACPHVSGLLAAFLSVRREFKGRPDEVKRILLENCNDLDRNVYHQGAGMPNLMKMLANT